MSKEAKKSALRDRRKKRIRKKIFGTGDRPRVSVFRSERHVYVQVIDDNQGQTLVSISSFEKGKQSKANVAACSTLGKELAGRCKAKNINAVVFDKNGYTYHGRIKALADGAREGGLQF